MTNLMTVGQVRKALGGRFDRVCKGGACIPLSVNGRRMYDPSLIATGLRKDLAERPAAGDADTDEILARYQDHGEPDNDGDEDAAMSLAVEREMRALLVALRQRVEEAIKST